MINFPTDYTSDIQTKQSFVPEGRSKTTAEVENLDLFRFQNEMQI